MIQRLHFQVLIFALLEFSEYVDASLEMRLHKYRNYAHANSLRKKTFLGATMTNDISGYLAEISFGTPPQKFLLDLDTGSSDLYVVGGTGASEFNSDESSTFLSLPEMGDFRGKYGTSSSSTANGTYFSDVVTVGNATVSNQIVALVDSKSLDLPIGLIGVGYENDESITSSGVPAYPNFLSSLREQGIIQKKAYSVSLGSVDSTTDSSILFDAIDTTKFTGPLTYFRTQIDPVTKRQQFLSLPVSAITLSQAGSRSSSQSTQTLPLPNNEPIVATMDTGTSLLELPPSVALPVLESVNAKYESLPSPHWKVSCNLPSSTTDSTLSFQFSSSLSSISPLIPTFPNTTTSTSANQKLTSTPTSTINTNPPISTSTSAASSVNIEIPLKELVLPASAFFEASATTGDVEECVFGVTNGTFGESFGWIFGDPFLRAVYMVVDLDDGVVGLARSRS